MATKDNLSIVRESFDFFNKRDFKAAAKNIDTNAEIINVPAKVTLRGPDGFIQSLDSWYRAFPDSKVTVKNIYGTGDFVTVEYTGTGTHTGTLSTPEGDIGPTNKKAELPCCDVVEFKNGKITRIRSYYDMATMMRQLELMPELKHH